MTCVAGRSARFISSRGDTPNTLPACPGSKVRIRVMVRLCAPTSTGSPTFSPSLFIRRVAAQASPACGVSPVGVSAAKGAGALRRLPRNGKLSSTAFTLESCRASPLTTTLANSSVSAILSPRSPARVSQAESIGRGLTRARSAPRKSADWLTIPRPSLSVKKPIAVLAATAMISAATRMRCSPARQSRASRRNASFQCAKTFMCLPPYAQSVRLAEEYGARSVPRVCHHG